MRIKNENGFSPVWIVVLIAIVGIVGVGYFVFQSNSDNNNSTANQETAVQQPTEKTEVKKEEVAKGTVIKTADSQFGSILFDGEGQAIYIWEVEKSDKAECYGDCAVAWPPVLTNGAPVASGDVKSDLLGTTKRTDGTTQVTYNGHPLYYYADEKPGEVKCHNISTHGGLWWVIKPNGVRAD